MISLGTLAAPGTTIEVDGRSYRLGELDQTDNATIEARILSKRGDPIAVAQKMAPMLTPEEREKLFAKAYDDSLKVNIVTCGDWDDFCNSMEGWRMVFWLSLRQHHPEVTEAEAARMLDKIGEQWVERFIGELQAAYPGATRDGIVTAALSKERGAMAELIQIVAGNPSKNPPRPVRARATETSPSRSSSGSRGFLASLAAGLLRPFRR